MGWQEWGEGTTSLLKTVMRNEVVKLDLRNKRRACVDGACLSSPRKARLLFESAMILRSKRWSRSKIFAEHLGLITSKDSVLRARVEKAYSCCCLASPEDCQYYPASGFKGY